MIIFFLDAIDFYDTFELLQVELSDPTNINEPHNLAKRRAAVSTLFGLFNGHLLGAIDRWLRRMEMPPNVSNQADYSSEYHQCYMLWIECSSNV